MQFNKITGNKNVPEPKVGYEQRKVAFRKYKDAETKGWKQRKDEDGRTYDGGDYILCERLIHQDVEQMYDIINKAAKEFVDDHSSRPEILCAGISDVINIEVESSTSVWSKNPNEYEQLESLLKGSESTVHVWNDGSIVAQENINILDSLPRFKEGIDAGFNSMSDDLLKNGFTTFPDSPELKKIVNPIKTRKKRVKK